MAISLGGFVFDDYLEEDAGSYTATYHLFCHFEFLEISEVIKVSPIEVQQVVHKRLEFVFRRDQKSVKSEDLNATLSALINELNCSFWVK